MTDPRLIVIFSNQHGVLTSTGNAQNVAGLQLLALHLCRFPSILFSILVAQLSVGAHTPAEKSKQNVSIQHFKKLDIKLDLKPNPLCVVLPETFSVFGDGETDASSARYFDTLLAVKGGHGSGYLGVRLATVSVSLAQAQPSVLSPPEGVHPPLTVQTDCVVLAKGDLGPLALVVGEAFGLGQGVEDHALADAQLVVVVEAARQNLVLLCLGESVVRSGPHVGEHGTSGT